MRVAGKTGTADLDPENRDGAVYASFVGTVLDRRTENGHPRWARGSPKRRNGSQRSCAGLRAYCSSPREMIFTVLRRQLSDQCDICAHRVVLAGPFALRPCIVLGASLEIEHAGATALHVPGGALFVEEYSSSSSSFDGVLRAALRGLGLRQSLRLGACVAS